MLTPRLLVDGVVRRFGSRRMGFSFSVLFIQTHLTFRVACIGSTPYSWRRHTTTCASPMKPASNFEFVAFV